jgi:lamin tail-like protein/uncharacterized protein DUF5689
MNRTRSLPVALTLFALASAVPSGAAAQVLITEVQPDPTSPNDDGEWVEIQNIGTTSVSIAGWTLSDFTGSTDPNAESTTRWTFPGSTGLSPGQTIVVAKYASHNGYADNTPAALYARPPTFELAGTGHDDPNVPNLVAMGGTSLMTLSNASSGDAVVLRDAMGTLVSGVEWGTLDRSVPGTPLTSAPGAGQSVRRVANTGSSSADFAIAMTPDPFTGFTGGSMSMPPLITNTTQTPRHLAYGDVMTVSSSVSDADGVASVQLQIAAATASTGAASGGYTPVSMAHGAGATYSATLAASLAMTAPATFHEQYLRYYVFATDTTNSKSTDPNGASSIAANTAYTWRNIMPTTASPISEAREELGASLRWLNHSARVEGIALTRRTAFVANRTNFYIMSQSSSDAIRVFSTAIVPQDVMPGDIVRVTGLIDQFNGLREITDPGLTVEVIGNGTPPDPTVHTIADLLANGEALESQLVRIMNVSFVNATASWPMNGNVDIGDGTGMLTVRITSIQDLSGAAAPTGTFDITGILGQFSATNTGGYQLYPRSLSDVGNGTQSGDAGMGAGDGGAGDDAGFAFDAGASSDAASSGTDGAASGPDATSGGGRDASGSSDGSRVDGGSGSSSKNSGGCSCSASAERRTGTTSILIALLAGLALIRRPLRRV